MASLENSDAAKRVMHFFHQSDYIVYVEGDDDVVFWEFLFDKFFRQTVYIKSVGGKEQLGPYINSILSGDINDFVAMDSDFSLFDETERHRNVVKTCGYSIENTLINARTLKEVVLNVGKISKNDIDEQECHDWLSEFLDKVTVLAIYDICNHICNAGETVVGDSCKRFLKSDKDILLCDRRISRYLGELAFSLDSKEVGDLKKMVEESGGDVVDFIRGHFLFSGAIHFTNEIIRQKRKKVSISVDSYFGALVMAFKNIFNETHSEYEYYKNIIESIKT